MFHDEGVPVHALVGFWKDVCVLFCELADVIEQAEIIHLYRAAFIEQVKDAVGFGVEQLDDPPIVREGDVLEFLTEALFLEDLLLLLEDLLNVELVQSLVRVVHAQLLKSVRLEDLKPVDVQQPQRNELVVGCANVLVL